MSFALNMAWRMSPARTPSALPNHIPTRNVIPRVSARIPTLNLKASTGGLVPLYVVT
jgi:hypothetical protein